MNTEKNAIRYKFFERFDVTSNSAIAKLGQEITLEIAAQTEDGYLPTGLVGGDDIRAFQFTLFPEAEAVTSIDDLDIEIFSSDDFAELEAEVEEQNDSGNDIVSLSFGDSRDGKGTWNVLFGEAENEVVYFSSDDTEEFKDLLGDAETDDRGLSLLDIDYGAETWVATFADLEDDEDIDEDGTGLLSNKNFDKLTGQIDRRLDKGDVSLVDLEYGDGLWFARYDSDPDLDSPLESTYTTSKNFKIFREEIEAQSDKGFDLVDVEYINGAWYGVLNESLVETDSKSASLADDLSLAESEASEII